MERKEELQALCGDKSELNFTWEIFANLLPELDEQQESNELQEVVDMDVAVERYKKCVKPFGYHKVERITYTGQINARSQMHGRGIVRGFYREKELVTRFTRKGTFRNDMPEGISVAEDLQHHESETCEFKEGKLYGKGTMYTGS